MTEIAAVRIPSAKKMERIVQTMTEDEDFSFGKIKLNKDKPRYEVAEPTEDDPDNTVFKPSFEGVIVLVKKNFYQTPEEKERGDTPKEKREVYVLRSGEFIPERMFLSPSSVNVWKQFVTTLQKSGQPYAHVLTKFEADFVKGTNGYSWSKVRLNVVRPLSDEEIAHVSEIQELTSGKIRDYASREELDRYEEEALGIAKPAEKTVDAEAVYPAVVRHSIKQDEDDDAPVAKSSPKPAAKKPVDDDDEDEVPVAKPAPKAASSPAKKQPSAPQKPGYPNLNDDDEDDAPKPKTRTVMLDDDDDE